MLTGFYNNLLPYISQTSLLDELKPAIMGSDSMFGIGEDAYRIGFLEEAARLGRLAKEKFSRLGIERMYCFMVVDASMFTDVLPKKFGIDFDFEGGSFRQLDTGKVEERQDSGKKKGEQDRHCSRQLLRKIYGRGYCRIPSATSPSAPDAG